MIGGTLYFVGVIVMVYNLVKTAKQGSFAKEEQAEAPALEKFKDPLKRGVIHRFLEGKPALFIILTLVTVLAASVFEFVPMFLIKSNIPTIASVKPYTPLELQGRDIYIREACNSCHSQLVVHSEVKQKDMVNTQKLANMFTIILSSGDQNEPDLIFIVSEENIQTSGIICIWKIHRVCHRVL